MLERVADVLGIRRQLVTLDRQLVAIRVELRPLDHRERGSSRHAEPASGFIPSGRVRFEASRLLDFEQLVRILLHEVHRRFVLPDEGSPQGVAATGRPL